MTLVGWTDAHYLLDVKTNRPLADKVMDVQDLATGDPVTDLQPPLGYTGLPFPAGQARSDGDGYYGFTVPEGQGPVRVRVAADPARNLAAGEWFTPAGQALPNGPLLGKGEADDIFLPRDEAPEVVTNLGLVSASQQQEMNRVLGLIRPSGDAVYVRRTSTGWEAGHQLDAEWFGIYTFTTYAAAAGGYTNLLQLETCYAGRLNFGIRETDPDIDYTGTWVPGTSGGETFIRSEVAGDTASYTFPSGIRQVSLVTARAAANGGYSKHVIVDDRGLTVVANLLPTAQEEVDAGRLDAAALTTNGGTLTPTDRVFDGYGGGTFLGQVRSYGLADGLDPLRTYTVTSTVTGYKRAESAGVRLYVCGFSWSGRTDTGAFLDVSAADTLGPISGLSAWEYAMGVNIGGQSVAIGNVHGSDEQTGFTVLLDGQPANLDVGEAAVGSTLLITRTSTLHHPQASPAGSATVRYAFIPGDGMWVEHRIDWDVNAGLTYYYPVMWPNALFKGSFAGGGQDFEYTAFDLSRSVGGRLPLYYAWQPQGDYAGLVYIDPAATDDWQYTQIGAFVEDRSAEMNKYYLPLRAAAASGEGAYTITPDTVWRSRALYRVARLPQADAALARL